jgi:hypothetical protein
VGVKAWEMINFVRKMVTNLGVAGELLTFLWQRKLFWLIPMVALLLLFGLLLVFGSATGVAPFIYTLF